MLSASNYFHWNSATRALGRPVSKLNYWIHVKFSKLLEVDPLKIFSNKDKVFNLIRDLNSIQIVSLRSVFKSRNCKFIKFLKLIGMKPINMFFYYLKLPT